MASVTLAGWLDIHGICIRRTADNRVCVLLPTHYGAEGTREVVHPRTSEARADIVASVLREYDRVCADLRRSG